MLMNATVARYYAEENCQKKINFQELEVIENAIKEAVGRGEFNIILNFICSPTAIAKLQENHYTVNCKNFTTYIDW